MLETTWRPHSEWIFYAPQATISPATMQAANLKLLWIQVCLVLWCHIKLKGYCVLSRKFTYSRGRLLRAKKRAVARWSLWHGVRWEMAAQFCILRNVLIFKLSFWHFPKRQKKMDSYCLRITQNASRSQSELLPAGRTHQGYTASRRPCQTGCYLEETAELL